jgi:SAM-dependent methyltransferase
MARAGVRVVGVDHSGPMLADLRARVRLEPPEVRRRIHARQGDMRKLRLGRRFRLVLATFNTVLHLYTRDDVERFLARVRGHLAPGGRFVADLAVPAFDELSRGPSRPYYAARFRHPTTGLLVKNREVFDYDPVRQLLFVSMQFEPVLHPARAWTTPFAHRQFFPAEWEALLHYNGFRLEQVHGDFSGGALDADSSVMIGHARLRGGA